MKIKTPSLALINNPLHANHNLTTLLIKNLTYSAHEKGPLDGPMWHPRVQERCCPTRCEEVGKKPGGSYIAN